jgi:F-type H+-transporting ATPase subunit delta
MPDPAGLALDPARAATVFDIDVLRVARVYAEALLTAAEKGGRVDEVWGQLEAIAGRSTLHGGGQAGAAHLLAGTLIPRGRRVEIIRKAFAGADPLVVNFLLVMNDHNRLDEFRAAVVVFRELMDERARRLRVQVTSAVPLTDGERDKVKAMARERFNDMDPVLVESVDPAVLGGIRVQVGDQVIDATVRTRIESLKHQLLTRSSHALRR